MFPCKVLSSCWQENVDQRVVQIMQDLEVLGDATGVAHREVFAHLCTLMRDDALERVVTSKRKKVKILHLLEMMQQAHCWG